MKTMKNGRTVLRCLALAALLAGRPAFAQLEETPPAGAASPAGDESALQSLEALHQALTLKEQEIAALQQRLAAAGDEMTREQLSARLRELRKAADEQLRRFEQFAVDIDLSPFIEQPKKEFNWQEELGKLLKPIMSELENATAESRAIGELRDQLQEVSGKRDRAETAVINLERLLARAALPPLRERLSAQLATWTRVRDEARNEFRALDLQLQSRLAARKSVLDETTGYVRRFFSTRGLNLLFGGLAFCAVFFGIRLVAFVLRQLRRSPDGRTFSTRLATLVLHTLSVAGGLVAMMLVFNLAGDWFLLGIVVIFLVGVGWASINTLPQHIETVKLMLNIGSVREGERLIFNDLPYRVESLGFSACLVNPQLDGGRILLPVKYLVGLQSRPPGRGEAWFPCRESDWVEIPGGPFGRVTEQTPELVELTEPGGARVIYRTADFLALHPRNLSGGFRVSSAFGLDYRHRAQCTGEIPNLMKTRLDAGLSAWLGPGHLANIEVLFAGAGASSLDYEIRADLAPAAAERYRCVAPAIQRILVEACNERGWVIPFPQLTVHRAGETTD